MSEEKRSCEGYEIIESRTIGGSEIVIGHNPRAANAYVCWYCKNGNDYYWGRYTNDIEVARNAMRERSEFQAKHFRENQKPARKRDENER